MKLKIAFDIDGCIVDLMEQFDTLISEDGFIRKPHLTYQIETDPEMSNETIWKFIFECYRNYEHTKFFNGASELFDYLFCKSQDPITFVTARPKWAASFTYLLMDRVCRVPYTINFSDKSWDKIYFLNPFHFFVEDRASTAKQIASVGKHVFMPDRHYNQIPFHSGITRILELNDLFYFIDQFI